MRLNHIICILFFWLTHASTSVASEDDYATEGENLQDNIEGFVALESRYFPHNSWLNPSEQQTSLVLQPEYLQDFETLDGYFQVILFGRLDNKDSQRTHADIRAASFNLNWDDWGIKVGIDKIFWGVTESTNIVDIINQTDLVEDPDGDEKLGQPIISINVEKSWGTLELFFMPFHRERLFPGSSGRFRTPFSIDTDNPEYESGEEDRNIDVALRYSHYIGELEFGISHFSGNSRDPLLTFNNNFIDPKLIPFYPKIDQTGIDIQYIINEWLTKFEAISRSGYGNRYTSIITGFEYTTSNVFDTSISLGWVAEYLFDDRSEDADTLFDNDIFLGLRFALNDPASSQALVGVILDTDTKEAIYSVESSRRFGDSWKLTLNANIYSGAKSISNDSFVEIASAINGDEKSIFIIDDDYVEIKIARYF